MSVHDPLHVRLGFRNSWGVLVGFIGSGKDNGISHKIINGEANDAPKEVASSWQLETLSAALKEYSPADIYNADETALFYKLMPNKTL